MTVEEFIAADMQYQQARWAILKDKELRALESGNMTQEMILSARRDEVYTRMSWLQTLQGK